MQRSLSSRKGLLKAKMERSSTRCPSTRVSSRRFKCPHCCKDLSKKTDNNHRRLHFDPERDIWKKIRSKCTIGSLHITTLINKIYNLIIISILVASRLYSHLFMCDHVNLTGQLNDSGTDVNTGDDDTLHGKQNSFSLICFLIYIYI